MIIYENYNEQLIEAGAHVTPFLKRVNISKSFCSFKVGFNEAIYVAPKLRLTLYFWGALHKFMYAF